MSRYFTHYWTNRTWTWEHTHGVDRSDLLKHTAGNLFMKRGACQGDHVYVLTVIKGQFYLLGKLVIGTIGDANTIARLLNSTPDELWEADDHLIAVEATTMLFDRCVPVELTQQLRFQRGSKTKSLVFKSPGHLDTQTLRGVRELTSASAQLLDSMLPPLQAVQSNRGTETRLSTDDAAGCERVDQRRDPMHPIAEAFADYFADWDILLPEHALEQRQRGSIQEAGWYIQYRFDTDDHGEYLDFYATHQWTHDRHHRIAANGDLRDLHTVWEG